MNRRTALSVVATAAALTVAAGRAQGQTLTLYPGLTYNSVTGNGYKSQSLVTHPGMTAGNGVGVGSASQYSNGSFVAGVAQRIDSSGNVIVLQSATAYSTSTVPYAVNAAGTAVGISNMLTSSGTSLGQAAVSWNASGGVTLLQNLGTNPNNGQSFGYAYAVNGTGVSAGQQYGYNSASGSVVTSQYATRWDASGNITQLAALSANSTTGSSTAVGYAINTSGTVVGNATLYSGTTSLGSRPTMWAGGGTAVVQMGVLGTSTTGTTSGAAYAVNDYGISVGNVTAYNSAGTSLGSAPTRWDASGNVSQLGTLGTTATGTFSGAAYAVNLTGTAVGYSTEYNSSGTSVGNRATIWAAGSTTATELPNLGLSTAGTTSSLAYSINDDGLAVGYATAYNSAGASVGNHATLWLANGSVVDLNTLLSPTDASSFVLTTANSISNTDWVTAVATFTPAASTGEAAYSQDVLLNVSAEDTAATPEPTSMALLATATAVPILARRRRRTF